MISTRWHKIFADFWDNKARSFLVIASISIGVFAVGMNAIGYTVLPDSLEKVYAGAVPANIILRTDPFDKDLVAQMENVPGVAAVEGRRTIHVRARPLDSGAGWESLELTVVQDFEHQELRLLSPAAGEAVPADRTALLIEEALPLFNVALGDTLEVQLADNTIKTLPITGITNDFSAGLELTFNARVGFITYGTLEYLEAGEYFDTLILTVTGDSNDRTNIEAVMEQVTSQLEDTGRQVYNSDLSRTSDHPYANYIDALVKILTLLGVLIVILSSFLIINTMNALMAHQLRAIGVMKLVGAQRVQIIGMYFVLVLFYGLLGLLLAIPTASFVGYTISDAVARMLNGRLVTATRVPLLPSVISLQAVVALVVPVIAAAIPIIQGARVTVQQALSGNLIRQANKISLVDRWLYQIRWARGIFLLAIRNTFRRMDRLILTLFTLSLGGGIFIAVFNVQASIEKQTDRIVNYANADIYLQFKRPYPVDEIQGHLQGMNGVTHVEAWQVTTAQLETYQQIEAVTLMAPPDNTQIVDPVTYVGRWVTPADQQAIVVNEAFLNTFPNLSPGNILTLKLNGEETEWTVVGMFHYSGLDSKLAYTTYDDLAQILGSATRSSSYRVVTAEHSLAYQQAMADQLDTYFREAGYSVDSATPLQERVNEATSKMDMIIFVLLVLASLTGLVGSIGLSGTLSLNVLERTAEIGILRAVGAYDTIVSRLVIYEGMFIGFVSYGIGVLLALPISKVLSDVVNMAIFKAPAEFVLTWRGFLIWLVIIIILSILASVGPARNATRLTIREVLAYE